MLVTDAGKADATEEPQAKLTLSQPEEPQAEPSITEPEEPHRTAIYSTRRTTS